MSNWYDEKNVLRVTKQEDVEYVLGSFRDALLLSDNEVNVCGSISVHEKGSMIVSFYINHVGVESVIANSQGSTRVAIKKILENLEVSVEEVKNNRSSIIEKREKELLSELRKVRANKKVK